MATLTFWGATEGVTGSKYLLETQKAVILLECGLLQGSRKDESGNEKPFPFDVRKLDAVVLSHAHLDHSGQLPRLSADGYGGPVYMTNPTGELLGILLRDAAFLHQRDVEWENKRRKRAGKKTIDPLYTIDNVEDVLTQVEGVAYGDRRQIAEGVEVCFRDAGHILGSAIVELFISEAGVEKKLVFSGDLGNSEVALLRDPEIVSRADVLLLESTYGDREHRSMDETLVELEAIIDKASRNGGNILIPSFAVGRTQEIIFRLGELYQRGKLKHQRVYLDSPMAIATTRVYSHFQHVYNTEDATTIRGSAIGTLKTFLPALRYSNSTEESMALNKIEAGAIFIAGSGMCNGGRIRHHLRHNVWRNNAHVIIIGYQAHGTPGRALVDGARTFKFGGENIAVNASIHTLGGFSAHAGQSQLLNWALQFREPRPGLYLIHGDTEAKAALSTRFHHQDWPARVPEYGERISI